jgi:hypothetical protein
MYMRRSKKEGLAYYWMLIIGQKNSLIIDKIEISYISTIKFILYMNKRYTILLFGIVLFTIGLYNNE